MMKFLILFLFSPFLFAAEITHVDTLNNGDPLWISEDGQVWQQVTFIRLNKAPSCPYESAIDKNGQLHIVYQCEENFAVETRVWYSGSHEGPMNYITGRDPNRAPVSREEMFGFQTRIKNILYADDLDSALGTVKEMYADRNRLIEVHEVVRQELLKRE